MKWLICLVMGHNWKVAGQGLQGSASWEEYAKCLRCGEDSREAWEIEDDTRCRMERLEIKIRERDRKVETGR